MREAAASEARNVNQTEVLIELAQESGLDVSKFIESFSDGTAEKAFKEDLKIARSYKAFGFPSFLVRSKDDKEVMLRGYQTFDTFKAVINQITNGKVVEKSMEKSEENIISFIKKFEYVAPAEITAVFDLSKTKIAEVIQGLEKQKLVNIIPTGNGYFVTPYSNPFSCNTETGVCRI